ncbi:hypothetical protein [Mycolicibacterium celeriflavum]|uniref:hypothetical protein n=1 Tax=Mycolicibacterium celeriflavum TaxID=1249101 RepID=UPI003CE708AC
MGSLGPPAWLGLLIAVAIAGALCGFATSTVMRRTKRHTKLVFVVGAVCGFLAGATAVGRRGTVVALRRAGNQRLTALGLPSRPPRRRRR